MTRKRGQAVSKRAPAFDQASLDAVVRQLIKKETLTPTTIGFVEQGKGPRSVVGFFRSRSGALHEIPWASEEARYELGDADGSPLGAVIRPAQISLQKLRNALRQLDSFKKPPGRGDVRVHMLLGADPLGVQATKGPVALSIAVTPSLATVAMHHASTGASLYHVRVPAPAFPALRLYFLSQSMKEFLLWSILLALALMMVAAALTTGPIGWLVWAGLALTCLRVFLLCLALLLERPLPPARRARLLRLQARLLTLRAKIEDADEAGATSPTPADQRELRDTFNELKDELDSMTNAGEIDPDTSAKLRSALGQTLGALDRVAPP